MRFASLDQWLAWQETLHHREIELGLDRVQRVWQRLGASADYRVVTVGGTNGKGSSVAMLESILRTAGYRVGAYTSPHLLRYNERVRINGVEASDEALCAVFEQIDGARGDISLTYFEFGTLAALLLFEQAGLDVAVLEVGMGGRLDAVNLLDADVALVASVGIDHTAWLGADRESIGREKAGIFRGGRPAVCGDPDPPLSLIDHAHAIGARLYRFGVDFRFETGGESWSWEGLGRHRNALPFPHLRGRVQLQNASSVLAVLELLAAELPVTQNDVRQGLLELSLSGRFQLLPGDIVRILDVAHNPDGARVLAANLDGYPVSGLTRAVFGMLADKDVEGVARMLDPAVDVWYVAGLEAGRGLDANTLSARLAAAGVRGFVHACPSVAAAWDRAEGEAQPGDRLVAFGSFYTVADVLRRCV